MSRNIIITGGTGFVGSNLVNTFKNSDRIYNLGRSENKNCEDIYWNLKDSIENIELPPQIDTIIHCASIVGEGNYKNRDYIEVNVLSTLELLEYCIKTDVTQFVYISTGGVYGYGRDPFNEEDQPKPKGIYSISKYFSEELCREYKDKIKISIVRPFFPYGKGQKERLLPTLISKIKNNEEIMLNNCGTPLINPIYIEDLGAVIKGVVDNRVEGIFNACGNEIISIKELCDVISSYIGNKEVKYIFNGNNVENLLGNNGKVQSILHNSIKTSIVDGLEKMITC